MKEFVYVEFIIESHEHDQFYEKMAQFDPDFEPTNVDVEFDADIDNKVCSWHIFGGKINSQTLTCIKLQDSFLSERLKISYIPDNLKDKYRQK